MKSGFNNTVRSLLKEYGLINGIGCSLNEKLAEYLKSVGYDLREYNRAETFDFIYLPSNKRFYIHNMEKNINMGGLLMFSILNSDYGTLYYKIVLPCVTHFKTITYERAQK